MKQLASPKPRAGGGFGVIVEYTCYTMLDAGEATPIGLLEKQAGRFRV